MGTLGIALSGIQSAQTRIAVSAHNVAAHNVANFLTEDFRPQRVEQTASSAGGSQARVRQSRDPQPVRLEREIVDQIMAKTAYSASARVFEVSSGTHGTLLDMFA